MSTIRYSCEQLERFCCDAFEKFGFTKEEVNASTSIGIKNVETRIGLWNKNVQLFMNRLDSLSVQVLVIPLENEELINEDIDH